MQKRTMAAPRMDFVIFGIWEIFCDFLDIQKKGTSGTKSTIMKPSQQQIC
jgi:hypothetical protein